MDSVCQALIRCSDVHLFDELTRALDLGHQLDVISRIKAAVVESDTIGIVALHGLNFAAHYADHPLLIGSGKILVQGSPAEVLSYPPTAETYDVAIQTGYGVQGRSLMFVHLLINSLHEPTITTVIG